MEHESPRQPGNLRQLVARGAAATLVLRAGGMGVGLIAVIVLARELGPAGYGTYSWASAWASALVLPAALGADELLSREAAVALDRGQGDYVRALVRSTLVVVAAISLAPTALGALIALAFGSGPGDRRSALLVALPILPVTAIATVALGAILGLGRTARAVWPATLARQAAFLLLVAIAVVAGGLSAVGAVALQLAAASIACVLSLMLLRRALAMAARGDAQPRIVASQWLRTALPMGAATIFLAIDAQVGLLVLGASGSAHDAGVYAAALQCLAPFVLVLAAGRTALTSVVARLGAAGERERLQRGLRTATRIAAGAAAVTALVLLVAPRQVLSLFGDGFGQGAGALRILAVAYLVNSACAFNGMVLIMRGEQGTAMRAALGCLLLDCVLCIALVPAFGPGGAALGVLVSVTVRNALTSLATWRRLGLDTTVLARDRS